MELCKKLSEYDREIFKLIDINDVELALDIQINVICAKNLNTITQIGEYNETKIYLHTNGNHFDVIKSAIGFCGYSYYCKKCDKSYNNKNNHKCIKDINVCKLCQK